MNFLWEGLNPIYLLPAIILVVYLHIVGLAANKKIGTSIPSILMGLLISLVIFSPLMLLVHWGFLNEYKIYFIALIIVTFFSSILLIKKTINLRFKSKLLISILAAYISSLFLSDNSLKLGHDYWLYGQWFTSGSNFVANNIKEDKSFYYGFTILYRWIGSFSGMISGPSFSMVDLNVHYEYQVISSFAWISITIQLLLNYLPDMKYKTLIPSLLISSLLATTFSTGFYGSFSFFFIFFILMTQTKNHLKNTIFLSLSFIFMASSIIVIFPAILITYFIVKRDKPLFSNRTLKFCPFLTSISGLLIIALNFNYNGHQDFNVLIEKFQSFTMPFISIIIISCFTSRRIKQLLMINSIIAILANTISNTQWNLLQMDFIPSVVIHRYMQSFLFGEFFDTSIILLTFPWAIHLLYNQLYSKRS